MLPLSPHACDVTWKQALARVSKSDEITLVQAGPNPVTGVLLGRGAFGDRHRSRRPCDNGGRDWSDTSRSQGTPRTDGYCQNREATKLLPSVSQGVRPCQHLMSDFSSSERREYSSVHHAILSVVLCACSPCRRMQRLPLLSFFDLLNHLMEPTVLSFLRSPLPLLCPSAWFLWAFWPPPTT